MKLALPLLALCALATAAHADPCEAPLPAPGATFAGQVRYIVDGDGLCVGSGADPATWIEVRLADFYALELHSPGGRDAKAALSRIVSGRRVECEASHRSYDRVVARCYVGGQALGDLMRAAGVPEGGRGR